MDGFFGTVSFIADIYFISLWLFNDDAASKGAISYSYVLHSSDEAQTHSARVRSPV
jgi:hypothetical protein